MKRPTGHRRIPPSPWRLGRTQAQETRSTPRSGQADSGDRCSVACAIEQCRAGTIAERTSRSAIGLATKRNLAGDAVLTGSEQADRSIPHPPSPRLLPRKCDRAASRGGVTAMPTKPVTISTRSTPHGAIAIGQTRSRPSSFDGLRSVVVAPSAIRAALGRSVRADYSPAPEAWCSRGMMITPSAG